MMIPVVPVNPSAAHPVGGFGAPNGVIAFSTLPALPAQELVGACATTSVIAGLVTEIGNPC